MSPSDIEWEQPDPGQLLLLTSDQDWATLLERYASQNNTPLKRCFEVARASGALSVVIETRYIDLDFRSEYSAFYSRTFESVSDSAHRLHFFGTQLAEHNLWGLPEDHRYLGYVVVRPSKIARVGRALLCAPPGLRDSVRTTIRDGVNLFGQSLEVEGVPFVQQDAQVGRCAHAAAWMCHYSAYRRGDVARQPMAEFSLSAEPGLGYGRPLPSPGLTVQQLLELLRVFGLPPKFYHINNLPKSPTVPWTLPDRADPIDPNKKEHGYWDTRIFRICCRFLNSGFPVMVTTGDHVFVLCGYRRETQDGKPDWIHFVRHDDQRGPYLQVGDIFDDKDDDGTYSYTPWQTLIVPLPDKLWLPPEPVEYVGGLFLQRFAEQVRSNISEAQGLLDLIDAKQLALRSYAITSNGFKTASQNRLDPTLAREYRLARLSRFVWVVEAIDRTLRRGGQPCVVGEAIFDATSSEQLPNCLALHVPGVAWIAQTDGRFRFPVRCVPDPYLSGGFGAP